MNNRYLTYVRYDTLCHLAALCTTITAKLTDNKTCFVISTERSDEKSMQALPRYFTVFSMTI